MPLETEASCFCGRRIRGTAFERSAARKGSFERCSSWSSFIEISHRESAIFCSDDMPQDIESMELVLPTPTSNLQRTTVDPQEKLHLALFISGLSVGGVERTMLALAHGLAERGHRVDLLV